MTTRVVGANAPTFFQDGAWDLFNADDKISKGGSSKFSEK